MKDLPFLLVRIEHHEGRITASLQRVGKSSPDAGCVFIRSTLWLEEKDLPLALD